MSGLLVLALFAVHEVTLAAGTPAGTTIQSRSRVVYTTASGTVSDTVYSNTVSFVVAQVAAVNITPPTNATSTNSDSVYVSYAMTITNSGNGNDQFNLTSTSSKGWSRAFYFDADGDGVLQPAELSAGAITQTGIVTADGTYKIIVRVFVPGDPSLNNQVDTTVVTAASLFDNTKNNAASVQTTVHTVYFSTIGTALSVSPTNPSPGQNVTYSMTLTNNGSVAAASVNFYDLVNASQFTYVSGTTTQGTFNGATVPAAWNIGTLNPGASVTVTIVLQVKAGLTIGTVLNNTISVTYNTGGNTFTVVSNDPYAAVGVIRGVSISPTSLSASKQPEDTLVYSLRVKNTGNSSDIIEMSYSSSKNYTWMLFKDVNANGVLDGGDTQLTDSPGSPTGVDVDSVVTADSVKILARLVVPIVSIDQDQDVTTFTAKSSADASKFQSAIATTTINIPVLSIVRSVTPSGNQPPGQQMQFAITYQNTGNGTAYNVIQTEDEPDSTSYVANSVTINNVAKTDAADADEVTVTTVSGRKKITITLGTIAPLSTQGTIRFRTTIH